MSVPREKANSFITVTFSRNWITLKILAIPNVG
jgi:hypothetical protein